MNKSIVTALVFATFFTFTIGQVQNAYDRIAPQVLYLSLINFVSLVYIFYQISFKKIIDSTKDNKLFLSYTAYIIITGISIIVAENKPEALVTYAKYITYFLTFAVFWIFASFSKINFKDLLFKLIIISIIIESSLVVYSVYDSVIINGNEFSRSNDYRGFSGNINITAFSLVIKSPVVAYYLFKSNNRFINLSCYLILFLTFSALLFLLTRGALIAFMLVMILLFSYMLIRNLKEHYTKIIISLVVFFISYNAANSIMSSDESSVVIDRVSTLKLNNEDESINQRLRYYSSAVNSIKKKPILGIGVGNWKFISIKYDSKEMSEYTVPYYAHNDFLQIGAEIGIIGLFFFVYLIFKPFLLLIRKIYNSNESIVEFIIFLMISVYIIDSMLNFPINRPISHIMLIVILVLYQQTKNKLKNEAF